MKRPRAVVGAALIAAGLAAAAYGAQGAGGSDHQGSTANVGNSTVTQSATVKRGAGTTQSNQTTQSNRSGGSQSQQSDQTTQSASGDTTSSGGGTINQSSVSVDGVTMRLLAGRGASTVTFTLDGPSRLLWSNTRGRSFSLREKAGALVKSPAGDGETRLFAGAHTLRIDGALWTVVLRPE
jgi:hypothetical protein